MAATTRAQILIEQTQISSPLTLSFVKFPAPPSTERNEGPVFSPPLLRDTLGTVRTKSCAIGEVLDRLTPDPDGIGFIKLSTQLDGIWYLSERGAAW